MKLSEFINRIISEECGGLSTGADILTMPNGTEVVTLEDGWDGYKVVGESGEWDDGFQLLKYLIDAGAIPDHDIGEVEG